MNRIILLLLLSFTSYLSHAAFEAPGIGDITSSSTVYSYTSLGTTWLTDGVDRWNAMACYEVETDHPIDVLDIKAI